MSRQALAEDRGLPDERTALAWTRTALAVAASGVLVLVRDGPHDVLHALVIAAVAMLAIGVFAVGSLRRRQLLLRPRLSAAEGRRYVPAVGASIIAVGILVVIYLAVPIR